MSQVVPVLFHFSLEVQLGEQPNQKYYPAYQNISPCLRKAFRRYSCSFQSNHLKTLRCLVLRGLSFAPCPKAGTGPEAWLPWTYITGYSRTNPCQQYHIRSPLRQVALQALKYQPSNPRAGLLPRPIPASSRPRLPVSPIRTRPSPSSVFPPRSRSSWNNNPCILRNNRAVTQDVRGRWVWASRMW